MSVVLIGCALGASGVLLWAAVRGHEGPVEGAFGWWQRLGWLPMVLAAGAALIGVLADRPLLMVPQVLLYAGFALYLLPLVLTKTSHDCRCSRVPTRPGWAGVARALGAAATTGAAATGAFDGGSTVNDPLSTVAVAFAVGTLMVIAPPAIDGPPVRQVVGV